MNNEEALSGEDIYHQTVEASQKASWRKRRQWWTGDRIGEDGISKAAQILSLAGLILARAKLKKSC